MFQRARFDPRYISYIKHILGNVKIENVLDMYVLTWHKPTISHCADSVRPVGKFGYRVDSNLVWLEIAITKVENKMVGVVFIIVKIFQGVISDDVEIRVCSHFIYLILSLISKKEFETQ